MSEKSIVSKTRQKGFEENGFLIQRSLFNRQEIEHMIAAIGRDPLIKDHFFYRFDSSGLKTQAVQWNNPGNSSYGVAARMNRIVHVVEKLLGGEVYHWQSKLTAKSAQSGGAWEWHQDYGYWYEYGCLYPQMCSVMVALDNCTKENGCLKVLNGSNVLGRLNHVKDEGGQITADPERVKWAKTRHKLVNCELKPGDVIFFHCNLLHSSGPNSSNLRRWALLFCYNLASNNPFKNSHNPGYRPLYKVHDNHILDHGIQIADGTEEFQSTYLGTQLIE